MDAKELIRKKILTQIRSLTDNEIERRSINVQNNIQSLSLYSQTKTIMVYYPLKGEPRLLGMIRKEFDIKRFCFPAIDLKNKKILPLEVKDLQNDFVRGPYGTMQPDPARTHAVALDALDMVLVPGLAFDRAGNRLGRGGGFYDRFLKRLPNHARTVGVAFDFQIVDNLPIHAAYDEKTDFIVTDTECI